MVMREGQEDADDVGSRDGSDSQAQLLAPPDEGNRGNLLSLTSGGPAFTTTNNATLSCHLQLRTIQKTLL